MASGRETFEAIRFIDSINKRPYTPANGAQYPGGEFGRGLQQIAKLIKADAGVEAAFVDIGGWDHHTNEAGQLTPLLQQFGNSLSAFAKDMGDRMADIVLVTMSEFGRTAKEDGNGGTDHGHGNVMMVLGGPVRGGKVYGRWPGLEPEQLYEQRDLAITTDFRDVLGELVSIHLGTKDRSCFSGIHTRRTTRPDPGIGSPTSSCVTTTFTRGSGQIRNCTIGAISNLSHFPIPHRIWSHRASTADYFF